MMAEPLPERLRCDEGWSNEQRRVYYFTELENSDAPFVAFFVRSDGTVKMEVTGVPTVPVDVLRFIANEADRMRNSAPA